MGKENPQGQGQKHFLGWVFVVAESLGGNFPCKVGSLVRERSLRRVGKSSVWLLLGRHSVGPLGHFWGGCLELLAGLPFSLEEVKDHLAAFHCYGGCRERPGPPYLCLDVESSEASSHCCSFAPVVPNEFTFSSSFYLSKVLFFCLLSYFQSFLSWLA